MNERAKTRLRIARYRQTREIRIKTLFACGARFVALRRAFSATRCIRGKRIVRPSASREEKPREERGEKSGRIHCYRATESGTISTIVFLRRRKIRMSNMNAVNRDSGRVESSRLIERTEERDTLLLRYGYCYYVRE